MKLSQIGELSLLDHIRKTFPKKSREIVVGIGDDAAVLRPSGRHILVTTDMMIEGVHFDLHLTTPYQLGFKLISVNVSDIYAMGGKPSSFLLNMALKKDTDMKFVDMLLDGVREAMNLYDLVLIGGDLSSADELMSLSATLIGHAKKYVLRSGANVGDKIYVTGNLGESACGLELLKKIKGQGWKREGLSGSKNLKSRLLKLGLSQETAEPLLRRHLMPEARNPDGFSNYATSMIDVSDGLLIDLTRLCNESRVGARIYEEKIPISAELKKAASCLGISIPDLVLKGGEDYELLFTSAPEKKIEAIYIGDVIKSKRVIVDSAGRERPFSAEGYQHF